MSTHLYLAPAASGKTRWVIDALRAGAAGLRGTPVAVVATPLQATSLRARLAQAGGALGAHILTFDELYALLLQHCGGVYTELAEPVRFRLLRGVMMAAQAAGQLPFYGGLAASPGFAHIVQELIGLLKGATITPEALAAAVTETSRRSGAQESPFPDDDARLHELALLYAGYQRLLQEQGWSDRAGMGWLALEAVAGCDQPLPPAVRLLLFDGFDDFTQIQLQVIAALAARLPEVVVTLTGDLRAANGEAEAQPDQRRYIRTAHQLRAALGVRAEPLPGAQPSPAPQVEMIEAANQAAEVRAALRWLKQRIVQDGCRPQEVALLARSLQPYRETAVQVAAEFGLPLRLVDGLPLAQNPAVAALLDLLRLARPAGSNGDGNGGGLDLPRRGMIEAWRSPYFDWGRDHRTLSSAPSDDETPGPEADMLAGGSDAGMLLAMAIEGRVIRGESQWREALAKFTRRDAGSEDDLAEAQAAGEALRLAQLSARFDRFMQTITPPDTATFAGFTRWIEQRIGDDGEASGRRPADSLPAEVMPATAWMSDPDAQDEQPEPHSLHLLACVRAGTAETASRDLAALAAFKDVLRGLIWAEQAAVESGEPAQAVSYAQFLNELAGAVEVASYLPPVAGDGAVLVASATQVRGVPLAAAAVVGLAEGEFPARIGEDPFLRDADRLRLRAQGLRLEPSTVSYERELFADCLARASRRLLLLRPRLAEGGAEWEPSPFWRETQQRLGVKPLHLVSGDRTQPPASAQELVERLAQEPEPSALAWLQTHFPGRWQRVQHGAAITLGRRRSQPSPFDGDLAVLAPALATRYGAGHVWSPSRLESYLTCPFLFLAGSVWSFTVRAEPEEGLDATQLGDIYHSILERVYQAVPDAGDLESLLAAARDVAAEVLQTAPQAFGFRATAWWAQECAAIQNRVQQALAGLHALGAQYRPLAFEQSFGSATTPLQIVIGNETLYVSGRIDRVDLNTATGKLRVIDYKTGSSGFDPAGLREGKKLQLPLYALGVQEALRLGEVEEGFYWLIGRGEPSALQLSRWEGGPAAAIATASAHVQAAAQGVRAGHFAGRAPADGCPPYCPAAAFCAHYRER